MAADGAPSLSTPASGANGGSIPALPGPLAPFGSLTGSSNSFSGPTIFAILTLLGLVAAGLSRWLRLEPDIWPPTAFLSLLGEPG